MIPASQTSASSSLSSFSSAEGSRITFDDHAIRSYIIDAVEGDREFVRSLVESYLESLEKTAQVLPAALEEKDWELLRRSAHSLKSSSRMFGISRVAETSEQIEELAKNKQEEGLVSLVAQVLEDIKLVERALPEHCEHLLDKS